MRLGRKNTNHMASQKHPIMNPANPSVKTHFPISIRHDEFEQNKAPSTTLEYE
jgi:hypothetical protein